MKDKIKKLILRYPSVLKLYHTLIGKKTNKAYKPKIEITGLKNTLEIDPTAVFYNCTFNIAGNDNKIIIGASTKFNNVTFYIRGNNNKAIIGKNVLFNRGGMIWMEDYDCETEIGEKSTFEDVHIAVTEPRSKISIGKDCMFAYDIDIRTGDSHSIIDVINNERLNFAKNVVINDHVWVAAHVSILKGVCIAENSVVATRAVVTKCFEEKNILIGGMPAKKLKNNINWDRKRLYHT